jgi:hypothetical protein
MVSASRGSIRVPFAETLVFRRSGALTDRLWDPQNLLFWMVLLKRAYLGNSSRWI